MQLTIKIITFMLMIPALLVLGIALGPAALVMLFVAGLAVPRGARGGLVRTKAAAVAAQIDADRAAEGYLTVSLCLTICLPQLSRANTSTT